MMSFYALLTNAPVKMNHQGPLPWADPGDSDIWKCLLSKSPSSLVPFVSESVLFPTPGYGNFFILNVETAPESEHHCHNPLGGMSESCQNPLGCMRGGGLGIHTDWCTTCTASWDSWAPKCCHCEFWQFRCIQLMYFRWVESQWPQPIYDLLLNVTCSHIFLWRPLYALIWSSSIRILNL